LSINLTEPLETKRLLIRQLTQKDYDILVKKLNGTFSGDDYPIFSFYKERNVYCFLLQLQEPPHIIGYIFLRTFEKNEELECHYALFPRYTGNGYAIEALRKVIEYIFTDYEFVKILAYVEQGNTRGWKVAERSGMKYMGDIFHLGKSSKVMYFLINKKDFLNQFRF
jgi:RimJ/RimL family protein N-acetyltransferase